jgi:phage shock protein E
MESYLLPLGIAAAFLGWRSVHRLRIRRAIAGLRAEGATVIDVRSPVEFAGGHVTGSLNIPLGSLAAAPIDADPGRSLIVCCASGTRSAVATGILRRRGFGKVINGGAWGDVARGLGA